MISSLLLSMPCTLLIISQPTLLMCCIPEDMVKEGSQLGVLCLVQQAGSYWDSLCNDLQIESFFKKMSETKKKTTKKTHIRGQQQQFSIPSETVWVPWVLLPQVFCIDRSQVDVSSVST